jgi:hypothetical protein
VRVIPDDEVHPALGDHDSVVGDGDLHLALEVEAAFRECQGQRALIVYLHAVEAQLALDIDAGPQCVVGQAAELVAFV